MITNMRATTLSKAFQSSSGIAGERFNIGNSFMRDNSLLSKSRHLQQELQRGTTRLVLGNDLPYNSIDFKIVASDLVNESPFANVFLEGTKHLGSALKTVKEDQRDYRAEGHSDLK